MTLEYYEGTVTVIPLVRKRRKEADPEIGSLAEPHPVRIPELFVRDSTFIRSREPQKNEKPRLALLYEDTEKVVKLQVRQIVATGLGSSDGNIELEEIPGISQVSGEQNLGLAPSHLIPLSDDDGMLKSHILLKLC